MKILVTGAGGFLGQAMVIAALRAGHEVRAWVRSVPKDAPTEWFRSEQFLNDLHDFVSFDKSVESINAVVHCAAVTSAGRTNAALSQRINVEAVRKLYLAARGAGVKRWIQISSMSAHPGSTSVYGSTKRAGDEILKETGNTEPIWTILKPSLIYGPGERGLVSKTLEILKKLPAMPLIGSGRELIRPIYVDDVAEAALGCLDVPNTYNKTYMIGGCDEIELREFLQELALTFNLRRPQVPIPLPVAMLLARVLGGLTPNPPISVDNVLGVREAQRVDIRDAVRDFGFAPIGVAEGLRRTNALSGKK